MALGLLVAPMLGRAGAYDAIYAFGDSLSDTGNIFAATGGAEPAAPYANGQFSNGAVWVQDLAAGLGVAPLKPSLLGGTDYAYGGAQTGQTPFHTANSTDLTGASGQVSQFEAAHANADRMRSTQSGLAATICAPRRNRTHPLRKLRSTSGSRWPMSIVQLRRWPVRAQKTFSS